MIVAGWFICLVATVILIFNSIHVRRVRRRRTILSGRVPIRSGDRIGVEIVPRVPRVILEGFECQPISKPKGS